MIYNPDTIGRHSLLVVAILGLGACATGEAPVSTAAFEEFCLRGEFDLGARLQGRQPSAGEWYPTNWCVVTSSDAENVRFAAAGQSNPDMEGSFDVSYLAPDRVRLVNRESPPDVEFRGTLAPEERRSVGRMDPVRLVAELDRHPDWVVEEREDGWRDVRWPGAAAIAEIRVQEGRLRSVRTFADLPLRGRVPVVWQWQWSVETPEGALELQLDGQPVFRAVGARRALTSGEADSLWLPSGGQPPREAPGDAWPAVIDMQTETLHPGVHIVRGVRTGFHHLVVETDAGLVVGDAPTGWIELHQLPPTDLVPGLGVSGLSERFIDHLNAGWPGVPIRAVVLTHVHDDHAGGARAFAAAGAEVYAPAAVAEFLEQALNSSSMPDDRLSGADGRVRVLPVEDRVVLDDAVHPVELISMGANPHVDAALGVYVPSGPTFFQSDIHVPRSTATVPPAHRLETECWFADWATGRLPPETVVHNSHGAVALTVGHLASYVADEACATSGP